MRLESALNRTEVQKALVCADRHVISSDVSRSSSADCQHALKMSLCFHLNRRQDRKDFHQSRRSKHKHHSSEPKRRRADDDGDGKHAPKRSRREGGSGGGDDASNHGSGHRKRSQREHERAADTPVADGTGETRATDAAAEGDAVMFDAAITEDGPAPPEAEPAANGAVAHGEGDEERPGAVAAKPRDRGLSRDRKRERRYQSWKRCIVENC